MHGEMKGKIPGAAYNRVRLINGILRYICFSSHFSPDGLLKIWDETKTQVSEVQLDESLTSACFLNAFGDVVIAFKNHIFFIDRAQGKIDEVKL